MSCIEDNVVLAYTPAGGYKAGKAYSVIPSSGDGDFTVTRAANTATRVNEDSYIEPSLADTPRIDYSDGTPVLLTEPQATNLLPYSEDFTKWTLSGATVDGGYECPMVDANGDNTLQGFKLVESAGDATHYIGKNIGGQPVNYYTGSIFVKAEERSKVCMYDAALTGDYVTFDLSTGTKITTVGSPSYSITQVLDGWYRISLTANTQTTGHYLTLWLLPDDYISGDNPFATYLGDGTSGIYIFGAQLETGSTATSYIPTNGSSETRSSESITGAGDATLFSSVNESGVLYYKGAAHVATSTLFRSIGLSDGTSNNRVVIRYNGGATNSITAFYSIATVAQAALSSTAYTVTNSNKIAFRWAENNFSLWINGTKVAEDLSGSVLSAGTFSGLALNDGGGGNNMYAKIDEYMVLPYKTDAEMITLTTP